MRFDQLASCGGLAGSYPSSPSNVLEQGELRSAFDDLAQVLDDDLGDDLLLDVDRRRVDHQVLAVLLVLPAPDELRVEVGVAGVPELGRLCHVGRH